MGDVPREQGEYLWAGCAHKINNQRRVPRANECLGDPLRSGQETQDAGPQGRVVERNLTPALANVRNRDPAQSGQAGRPRRLLERVEVKDARKELGW